MSTARKRILYFIKKILFISSYGLADMHRPTEGERDQMEIRLPWENATALCMACFFLEGSKKWRFS